jgi:hypothetical protein
MMVLTCRIEEDEYHRTLVCKSRGEKPKLRPGPRPSGRGGEFTGCYYPMGAFLHHRHMSQHLTLRAPYGIKGIMMPAAGTDTKSLTNAWKKTNEQELFNNLKIDYGFSKDLARSLVQLMHEHIETNYGNLRGDSQVIYHAVSMQEPPGKSIDHLRLVPVSLTISHPDDAMVLREQGVTGLRKHKLLRFANESYDQGGLLIQEDLALLLTTSIRTIQRDMQEMRSRTSDRLSPIKRRSLNSTSKDTNTLRSNRELVIPGSPSNGMSVDSQRLFFSQIKDILSFKSEN